MSEYTKSLCLKLSLPFLLGIMTLAGHPASGQEIDDCKNALEQAVERSDVQDYVGVLDILQVCPLTRFEPVQRSRAYDVLAQALQSVYADQHYDRVILVLEQYPPADFELPAEQKVGIYEILAEAYLKQKDGSGAKEAMTGLAAYVAKIGYDYTPDAKKLSDEYTILYEQVEKEMVEPYRKSSKKWYWIGGASAFAAGITAALLLSGGGQGELPGPPGPPSQ